MATGRFIDGLIIAALLSLFGLASVVQAADEDAALRRKALALNDVTGDNPILGEIKSLVSDRAGTRKLLGVAVSMAKQKEQPFTYNGAYILASTALTLHELDASKVFYRICAEQASKLQSAQKLGQAYIGILAIIELLYDEKKYEDSLKLSQEFLEILDRQGVRSESKSAVLRQMSRVLVKQGKVEEANRLIDNLLKARESDWRNLELKAWLQSETGHTDEALKIYEKVLGRIADDEELEKEDKTDAQELVRRSIIRLLVKVGKADEASRVMEDILKEKKDNLSKLELKGQLQQTIGHYSGALKTYKDLLERIPKDDSLKEELKAKVQQDVQERMILLLVKLGKVEEASRVMEDMFKGKNDGLPKLELKAKLQQVIGQYSAAAKTYEELLERIAKDVSLNEEQKATAQKAIRYALSNVYVELDRIDKATEQLKMLLAEEPDSPSYNNDLGYIWADHDKNLDEAEKMIRKAIEKDKDNPAYLDSLGWVLFKQKKYQEAKKWLLEAIKAEEGKNIEIYDHLADVHMALGEKAQAVEIWKKALSLETNSLREQHRKAEVEKKLKANE